MLIYNPLEIAASIAMARASEIKPTTLKLLTTWRKTKGFVFPGPDSPSIIIQIKTVSAIFTFPTAVCNMCQSADPGITREGTDLSWSKDSQ